MPIIRPANSVTTADLNTVGNFFDAAYNFVSLQSEAAYVVQLRLTGTGFVLAEVPTTTAVTGSPNDLADAVLNMAARPAIGTKTDGYRVSTATNGLTWVLVDGAYQVEELETTVATIAARDALTEQQTGQRVYCVADDAVYRWNGTAWVTRAVGAADMAAGVHDGSLRGTYTQQRAMRQSPHAKNPHNLTAS
jgi:hypothetical protein